MVAAPWKPCKTGGLKTVIFSDGQTLPFAKGDDFSPGFQRILRRSIRPVLRPYFAPLNWSLRHHADWRVRWLRGLLKLRVPDAAQSERIAA